MSGALPAALLLQQCAATIRSRATALGALLAISKQEWSDWISYARSNEVSVKLHRRSSGSRTCWNATRLPRDPSPLPRRRPHKPQLILGYQTQHRMHERENNQALHLRGWSQESPAWHGARHHRET